MEDISLDQYIKNNKSSQSGGRARRFNNTDSPKTFQRRINIRNNFKNESSPVKFTARLDTTSINGGGGGSSGGGGSGSTKPLRRIPVRSHNTTTTTTTTSSSSSSSSAPPPLKITIQNNTTTTKKEVRERQDTPSRFDNNNLPRIRITKTVDRNSSLSRPIIRSSRNNFDSRISSGGRSISSRYSVDNGSSGSGGSRINIRRNSYDSDHSTGSGPTLFERRNSGGGGYNGPTGKSLQLFTGSRLNISNLHHAISEADLKVLFDSLGEIKQIKIHYDHSGRSDGTGYVIYSRHNDAMAALKKYNGAQLDGRTLKITTGPSLQEDVRKNF
ncbi:RNA-binding region RNP-1 domain-containing protein [Dictyostelium discoideum AX4]|uniref:RNA-binding region RNP-1 domain-containing protein n=1 Tax=Dictyostelium discoideum TaxID=44689 RepID=Q54NB4_DICDI|nr:RNA-binding region RNP-1 domain-containing protein [Dictyostelium discoideum AX4]EAL64755.1 RNA-binding region RNP-1 domain-containing protein [Dictyostelium discoideum AX4]|eukprot:XP_638266.1 RNA-binding region RNP-1 domain-containing protein [Dictyostelium discoideum AX4]